MNADISYIMSCSDDEFERVTGVRLPEDAWDRWSDDMDKRKNQLLALFEKSVAAEREACAKVCEDLVPTYLKDGERWLKGRNGKPDSRLKDLAPNLEAAWEAEQLLKHGSVVQKITEAHICADAIRSRGQA